MFKCVAAWAHFQTWDSGGLLGSQFYIDTGLEKHQGLRELLGYWFHCSKEQSEVLVGNTDSGSSSTYCLDPNRGVWVLLTKGAPGDSPWLGKHHFRLCFSKCGSQTSSISTMWEFVKYKILELHFISPKSETLGGKASLVVQSLRISLAM